MQTHHLKTWLKYYAAIASGEKSFEFRKNDRGFKVGDRLVLEEYNELTGQYTGRSLKVTITYILEDFVGLEEGHVVLAIKKPRAVAAAKFIPPTKEEAYKYFIHHGGTTKLADAFINHFTSNGWKVGGKAPMVDWKAAANNFIDRDRTPHSPTPLNGIANAPLSRLI